MPESLEAEFVGAAMLSSVGPSKGLVIGIAVALEARLERRAEITPIDWSGGGVANCSLAEFADREVSVTVIDVDNEVYEARARVTEVRGRFLTLTGLDVPPPFALRPERYE
jgi:hypothetical protein